MRAETEIDRRFTAASLHRESDLIPPFDGADDARGSVYIAQVVNEYRAHTLVGHATRGALVGA
jgi:hypothetical protein